MSTLNETERIVSELSPENLAAFRAWFAEFDADFIPADVILQAKATYAY